MEYQIHKNRPGLLGDIASVLGMMKINIITINGVDHRRRGMLLQTEAKEKVEALSRLLNNVDKVTVTALRPPTILDRLATVTDTILREILEVSAHFALFATNWGCWSTSWPNCSNDRVTS